MHWDSFRLDPWLFSQIFSLLSSAKCFSPLDFICQPNSCFLSSSSLVRRIPTDNIQSILDCCRTHYQFPFLVLISPQLFFSPLIPPPHTHFLIMASICLLHIIPLHSRYLVLDSCSMPFFTTSTRFLLSISSLLLSSFLLILCFPTY